MCLSPIYRRIRDCVWPIQAVGRRPIGHRSVKTGQKHGQGVGCLRSGRGGSAVGKRFRHPHGDSPRPQKPLGRLTDALREEDSKGRVRPESFLGQIPDCYLEANLSFFFERGADDAEVGRAALIRPQAEPDASGQIDL